MRILVPLVFFRVFWGFLPPLVSKGVKGIIL